MIVGEKSTLVDVDITFQLDTADQSDYMGSEIVLSFLYEDEEEK